METAACTLPVTYVKCAFCTAKNHCAACGAELTEALEARSGVENAAVSAVDKGALDCTVRARVSAAAFRCAQAENDHWEVNK